MRHIRKWLPIALILLVAFIVPVHGQGKKKPDAGTEDEYYKLLTFELPKGEVLEAGAIEVMPDGRIAVGTRRGEIWMIDNAYAGDPKDAKWTRFAHGLHEVLGLAQKDGWLYVTHRPEVTRIKDTDGDGKADLFESSPTAGRSTAIITNTPSAPGSTRTATSGSRCA